MWPSGNSGKPGVPPRRTWHEVATNAGIRSFSKLNASEISAARINSNIFRINNPGGGIYVQGKNPRFWTGDEGLGTLTIRNGAGTQNGNGLNVTSSIFTGNEDAVIEISLEQNLSASGDVKFNRVEVDGDVIAAAHLIKSDRKLKSNIRPVGKDVHSVNKIPIVQFRMDGKERIGVIAQDVEARFPSLVKKINGTKHVNCADVMFGMISAMREEIANLKKKLNYYE